MDYLIEAKKFVERAHEAAHPEVIKQHLKMAEWYLAQAIEERFATEQLFGDTDDHAFAPSRWY